ncbi:hypothetical protein ACWER9_07395 [Micromonospora sp. NPDC003944]
MGVAVESAFTSGVHLALGVASATFFAGAVLAAAVLLRAVFR